MKKIIKTFRIDEKTLSKVERVLEKKNMTISDYLRELIIKDLADKR